MNPSQLRETTMDPDTRRLVRLTLDEAFRDEAVATFDKLLGKKNADKRRQWLEDEGDRAEVEV
jgi:topoisomerase-4 subunit B